MRDHATPAAFRAAVEAKLRARAHRLGVPAYIVRRQAALERLLVPLERQVAEKLHAYTRTYKGGGTTRVRDLVDLQLIREHEHAARRRRTP